MGALKKTFISGLLVMLPVAVTAVVLWWAFQFLDSVLGEAMEETLGIYIPGLGLLVALALIFVVGLMTRLYVGKKLLGWGDALLARIPLVRIIYVSMRQLMQTFTSGNRAFRDVVVLEYPRRELFTLGFVTGFSPSLDGRNPANLTGLSGSAARASGLPAAKRMLRERRLEMLEYQGPAGGSNPPPPPAAPDDTLMHVFVPTTPNPTSGYLLLVPWRDLVFLDASIEDTVRFIISGGVLPLGDEEEEPQADALAQAGEEL